MRRAVSSEKLEDFGQHSARDGRPKRGRLSAGILGLPHSPSMPLIATLGNSFPMADEELGQLSSHNSSSSNDNNNDNADQSKAVAMADQSKSVAIDMPPDDQLEASNDDKEVAAADDDASDDVGLVL